MTASCNDRRFEARRTDAGASRIVSRIWSIKSWIALL
jgi:hypothetical protein